MGKLRETEQAAITAIRDKEAKEKEVPMVTASSQLTEISKLKQQISELQTQLENSSINKGGGATDAMKDKLITTTVSIELIFELSCHGDVC